MELGLTLLTIIPCPPCKVGFHSHWRLCKLDYCSINIHSLCSSNSLIHTPWEKYTFLFYWCWTWQCNILGSLDYVSPHFDFGLGQLTCFSQWYSSRDDASEGLVRVTCLPMVLPLPREELTQVAYCYQKKWRQMKKNQPNQSAGPQLKVELS